MADRPESLPKWATDPGADVVEPPEGKQAQGWIQGEKPPAGFFNWLFRLIYLWLAWLDDKLKASDDYGISVPEGVETSHVETGTLRAMPPPESSAPAVRGTGRGEGKPGGLFDGPGALVVDGSETTGGLPAIKAKSGLGADSGPCIELEAEGNVARGLLAIRPSRTPLTPKTGDVFLTGSTAAPEGRLRYYDGAQWVTFGWPSAMTRRRVVGASGEPALGADWAADNEVSFYSDGRRVWLSGRLSRSNATDDVIFTLPAGYRPAQEVVLAARRWPDDQMIDVLVGTNGEVSVLPTTGIVSAMYLDGLSFEVAP